MFSMFLLKLPCICFVFTFNNKGLKTAPWGKPYIQLLDPWKLLLWLILHVYFSCFEQVHSIYYNLHIHTTRKFNFWERIPKSTDSYARFDFIIDFITFLISPKSQWNDQNLKVIYLKKLQKVRFSFIKRMCTRLKYL